MRVILAIETATACGSVALWSDGVVVAEAEFKAPRGHNTAIFGPLQRLLEEGRPEVGEVVVGTGPGSYGGVRVGITVANTLGAALGIAAVGVPSLLAARATSQPDYTVVGDARRNAFFVARVRGRRLAGAVELFEEVPFREVLEDLAGAGESIITFDESEPAAVSDMGVIAIDTPGAGVLAALYSEMSFEETEALRARPLEPIYLRAPYITTPKER